MSVTLALLAGVWALAAEVAPPAGWEKREAKAPATAVYVKPVWEGEAAITVERHPRLDGQPTLEAFQRQLGGAAAPAKREVGGKTLDVFEDIPLESFPRRVPESDPYAASLGAEHEPPDIGFFERRTFPIGGEAYRLYRCRKLGAWTLLKDYRKARSDGSVEAFRARGLAGRAPEIVSACFGNRTLAAMQRGEDVEDMPKPSMGRLRLMARDEWNHGAIRRLERESAHVRAGADWIVVVRYRAPERVYRRDEGDFLSFLAALELP